MGATRDASPFDARQELEVVQETPTEIHLAGRYRAPALCNTGEYTGRIEVVLNSTTMFPKQITYWEPSHGRRTIEYTEFYRNPSINPEDFNPKVPEGWHVRVIEGPLCSCGEIKRADPAK